jgi:hypothetical protein
MRKAARRWGVFLALVLFPSIGAGRAGRPGAGRQPTQVCNTGASREAESLARAEYYETRDHRAGFVRPVPAAGTSSDQGDVALIEDDGSIVRGVNLFDLAGKSIRFEPASRASYNAAAGRTVFDPGGGTPLVLGDDDARAVELRFLFTFYGNEYTSVWVNSDGNLTFGRPDTASSERDLTRFTAGAPRIGALFADLDPSLGGVSVRRDPDGIIFIWNRVPAFETATSNSFSVKLFKTTSAIEITYGTRVDQRSAVVGISPGSDRGKINGLDFTADLPVSDLGGTLVEFFTEESDFSEAALARRFYQTHSDVFDQLIVFLTFSQPLVGGSFAYEINVRNDVAGIGLVQLDNSMLYGSRGRLRSFVLMGPLDGPGRYPDDPNTIFFGTNSTLGILGQEVGHRWLAFTPFDDGGNLSRTILGRQSAHWSFFFDSDGSVMEGNDIEDRGEDKGSQRFTTVGATYTYSMLDRYVMGLVPKREVSEMFVVENPTSGRSASSPPAVGVTFGGTRKRVTVDSIIGAAGARSPSVLQSPKVFRQAFVLLSRSGRPADAAQIAKVQRIRDAWVDFFNRSTGERGWIVTDLASRPGSTASTLYFPHAPAKTARYLGVALANWGKTAADVLLTQFDDGGRQAATDLTNPRMITLAPGEQVAMLSDAIHGPAPSGTRGWIRADSSSSEVSGYFVEGAADRTVLDGAAAASQSSTVLYFTRPVPADGGATYANTIELVNPGSEAAGVDLEWFDDGGVRRAAATRKIDPRGRLGADAAALFDAPGAASSGYVRATSAAGLIGYQSLETSGAIAALAARPPSTASTLYSAQFASGRAAAVRYFTDLSLTNTSTATRRIEITLLGDDGRPAAGVTNPVVITLAPGARSGRRGESLFGLPDARDAASLTTGSLVVRADGPGVLGDVLFGDALDGRFLAAAALDDAPASSLLFSQLAQGRTSGGPAYFTGLALHNPNADAITATIELFSESGERTGSARLLLGSGERVARTLPEYLPGMPDQHQGYLRITTQGGPVVALETIGDQALEALAAAAPQKLATGTPTP